ncbi:MAG: glycine cleavage system protein GcvH [Leptospiraceae bacterium]|nr:glycine cleavage system protein GcvH [Leptospiraceae bacterium]
MKVPENHYFTEKHEWLRIDGDFAYIGISDFAQNALGDLVFIDLAKNGKQLSKGASCGTIESVKAAEDLYSPISGEVVDRNEIVIKDPSIINQDSYSNWMLKLKNFNKSEIDGLLNSDKYKEYIATLG